MKTAEKVSEDSEITVSQHTSNLTVAGFSAGFMGQCKGLTCKRVMNWPCVRELLPSARNSTARITKVSVVFFF